MDSAEKIILFKTFEDLTREIIRDRDTGDMLAQRYPVRFIMLNNFNEFKNLAKFMANIGVDALDLENLIEEGEDDTWITKDMLKTAIENCEKSTFVSPFSELARFFNDEDFRGFFNEIMLQEDIHHPKKRIYIPLIGLQNRFTDFLNHFARIQESAPIWRYDAEPQSVEVFFAKYKDFKLPSEGIQCQLDSLRDWLKFWKVQAPQERIVCSSIPIAAKFKYSKPDNIFNFTRIGSPYEFMTKFLELKFPFEYDNEDRTYWEDLLNNLDKDHLSSFSFESFTRSLFNKVTLTASDVISEWLNTDNTAFKRWVLKNYVLHTSFKEDYPYLVLCMEGVSDMNDEHQLSTFIATRILYELPTGKREAYAEERRKIIVDNKSVFRHAVTGQDQEWLLTRTKEMFQKGEDLNVAIDICTGVFDFEKILLMGWFAHYPTNKRLKSAIEQIFPEFAAYISSVKPSHFRLENQWCIDYFAEYKKAKLADKYTEEIAGYIKGKNESAKTFYKWYYEFENSHSLLAEVSNSVVYKPDKVYWIDGLGAEFLSYILYLIEAEHSNLKVVRSQISRADVPSSTLHNRFDGDEVKKFGALDELGHDSHMYQYLYTLKDELKVLKEIVHEIIGTCKKQSCTIAIVSDHGLSCLSRKAPSKKYDGKYEHEGRYIKTTVDAQSDPDYLVHKNEKDGEYYKVALTHSSLSKAPTHQVHGGCTPEEVLVPFILLSNKNVPGYIKYEIKMSPDDVMLSNPAVSLTVIPEPKGVTLTCEGKSYKMDRVGTQWTTVLLDITEGSHIIDVKPDGAQSHQYFIKVVGIGGESDINDMFEL
ncbi:MAG: BREX-4 system phosphatase PglZ [Prevotella sp.]|nr:BREX-4 system phosphatase PglZ [Prevotella sp.]